MTVAGRAHNYCIGLTLLETRIDLALSGRGAERLADLVTTAWERCLADPADRSPATVVELFLDGDEEAVARARERSMLADSDELRLMDTLSSHLTRTAIQARLGELWMLHACALAHPETGATVVLVGPSGSGKTTVAATLGRHFGYLSDETVAIRHDGTVLPYPKPLSVLVDGRGPKRQESPSDLGLLVAPSRPWLKAIALLDRTGSGRSLASSLYGPWRRCRRWQSRRPRCSSSTGPCTWSPAIWIARAAYAASPTEKPRTSSRWSRA